ncbi:MAG: hypothetical protein RIC56_03840 [Pseudomonadales bacterium]
MGKKKPPPVTLDVQPGRIVYIGYGRTRDVHGTTDREIKEAMEDAYDREQTRIARENATNPRTDYQPILDEYDRYVKGHQGKTRGAIAHVRRKLGVDSGTVKRALESRNNA